MKNCETGQFNGQIFKYMFTVMESVINVLGAKWGSLRDLVSAALQYSGLGTSGLFAVIVVTLLLAAFLTLMLMNPEQARLFLVMG